MNPLIVGLVDQLDGLTSQASGSVVSHRSALIDDKKEAKLLVRVLSRALIRADGKKQ